ncbi:MAG: sulfatase-like hydrolase/transferase, partial [Polyangiales bacterium]
TAARRALLVAHLRGAHPPFEISPESLKSMPPATYAGPIDPRHVVSVMAKVRRGLLRLSANDHERLAALSDAALDVQLQRVSAIVDGLRAAGLLDDTLIIVTGDAPFVVPSVVASPAPIASASASASKSARMTPAPHDDRAPLEMPLLVRFPGGAGAGTIVEVPTDSTDVAATILASFGASTGEIGGRDLRVLLARPDVAIDTPRLIDDGRGYQLVYADLRLVGAWGRTPQLRTRTSSEDLREARPFEYAVAWSVAADARARWIEQRSKGAGREPATIDSATAAAMDSWEKGAVTTR